DLPRLVVDVTEVGGTVRAGRRTYGNEDHLCTVAGARCLGGEPQPALGEIAFQHFRQTRHATGRHAALQLGYFPWINVDADDLMSYIRQSGGLNQSYVSRTENADFHIGTPCPPTGASANLPAN